MAAKIGLVKAGPWGAGMKAVTTIAKLVVAAGLLVTGCGDEESAEVTLESIQVSGASGAIDVSGSRRLTAIGTFSDGTTGVVTDEAAWTTSASEVATVEKGLVTGAAEGIATITAAMDGASGTLEVEIAEADAAGWSPDGVIGPEEYSDVATYDDYELHWSSDDEFLFGAARARTTGWVALGVQPGERMKDADIVFGFVEDGVAKVYDLFSTGDFGPHPPDTELGGTDDIVAFGGSEQEGFTTIEFKRALATGDQYDNELTSGSNQIIWSYGSNDSIDLKHTNRGYGDLPL